MTAWLVTGGSTVFHKKPGTPPRRHFCNFVSFIQSVFFLTTFHEMASWNSNLDKNTLSTKCHAKSKLLSSKQISWATAGITVTSYIAVAWIQ